MMIPISRAIDTLVINLGHEDSSIKNDLRKIRDESGHDFIQWREI